MAFRRPWLIPEDPMPKSAVRAGMVRAAWKQFPDATELGLIGLRETYATRAHARMMLECGILLDALTGDGPTQWRAAVEFAASHGRCTLDIGRRSSHDLLLVLEELPSLFISNDSFLSAWRPRILGHEFADPALRLSVEAPTIRGIAERTGNARGWALIDCVGSVVSSGNLPLSVPLVRGEAYAINLESEEITMTSEDFHAIGLGVVTSDGRHWRIVRSDIWFDAVTMQEVGYRYLLRRDRASEIVRRETLSTAVIKSKADRYSHMRQDYSRDRGDVNAKAPSAAELVRYRAPEPAEHVAKATKAAKKVDLGASMRARSAPPPPPKRGLNAPRRR